MADIRPFWYRSNESKFKRLANRFSKACIFLFNGTVSRAADFLEKSVQFAADVLTGKKKIERKDFSNDSAAFEKAIATGKAAVAKKYNGAEITSPLAALELIKAAQKNTVRDGFAAETKVLCK